MKIKSQFHLLLAGIIIIPFTLISIIISQNYANRSQRLIIPDYDEFIALTENPDSKIDEKTWKILQKKLNRRPTELQYIIFDKDFPLFYQILILIYQLSIFIKNILQKIFLITSITQGKIIFIKLIQRIQIQQIPL